MIANPEKVPPVLPAGITIVAKPPKKKSKPPPSSIKTLVTPPSSPVVSYSRPPHVCDDDQDEKRELLFKMQMMRKKNPHFEIPEYSMNSELNMMRLSYNLFIRRLTIDSTVENYKQYLMYGFIATEMVISRFTTINMAGFTAHQQSLMNSYETLLIELGEKIDPDGKSKIPVEIRLVLMVSINSIIFVVARMAFTPDMAARFLQNMTPTPERKKMRRPDEVNSI